MNTNKIKNTEAKNLWQMIPSNKKRIVTPNYFNLIVALDKNEANLLNFLIKESSVYNTISYSTRLMIKYRAYIRAIERNFNDGSKKNIRQTKKATTNIHAVRDTFIKLIEKGLIFRVSNSEYLINFGLTYMVQYSAPAIKWTKHYNTIVSLEETGGGVLWAINDQILKEIRK